MASGDAVAVGVFLLDAQDSDTDVRANARVRASVISPGRGVSLN